jgi:hypothetical protein
MDNSSDRDHRRGVGGDVMLAYGLNKNLKKMSERPKSAKPQRKKKKAKGKKKLL